ncbi:hypothetical protein BDY19DRAFT_608429 [Irpex rosettiformis]|uniref:Uncharacterized protein n=1 Tax=Irpex rosettiformis TaxID=378272 RepID=A0ACB8TPJ0_9APHY|nr:hypothetical protein BDY19DRAFT_608429 [Irpex rosettiformis]
MCITTSRSVLFRVDVPAGQSPETCRIVDDGSVVFFWTDICLLCALGLIIVAAVPCTVARFSRRSEWWKGRLLKYYNASAEPSLQVHPLSPESTPTLQKESCYIIAASTRPASSYALLLSGMLLALGNNTRSFLSSFAFSPQVVQIRNPQALTSL